LESLIIEQCFVEQLRFLSRGWLGKADKLIYLRGLAAHWSWRNMDVDLIEKRLQLLSVYPDVDDQIFNAQWLNLLQSSGACLFDSLAMTVVRDHSASVSAGEWREFIATRLNLDHTWVPFHLLRDVFSNTSKGEIRAIKSTRNALMDWQEVLGADEINQGIPSYHMEPREIFPGIYQAIFKVNRKITVHQAVWVHLYVHESPGKQISFPEVLTHSLNANRSGGEEYNSPRLILDKQRVSGTVSWYDDSLACRVYASWNYIEL